jgi:RNA polymerase sigma factor (sigma-70 family)
MIVVDSIENKEATADLEASKPDVEQLQATLNRYCLSITGSSWDAEDLAQDTWLKALAALKQGRHQNPEALLLRIAKNNWIDQLRRKHAWSLIMQQQRLQITSPEYGLLNIEMAFEALIKHLSPLQRSVFLLRDVCGYSNNEAAGMLNTTEGAVKAALHRARHALGDVKKELEEGGAATPVPSDENLKTFLRILAALYEMGDITTLVELVQRDDAEPLVAIGIAQTRAMRKSRYAPGKMKPSQVSNTLSMAA